ncbi:hypothetical protein RJ639_015190 [Escallonia herrerae]|uniref:Heptahelical transmembrane protein 1-like n=1 Tax=Escallonia herrerae TaxID=1293975 RepID=A0AA88VFM3_9ASTE|nr:hypothetical protein RJ639_015190 [Escallonia herrerae]
MSRKEEGPVWRRLKREMDQSSNGATIKSSRSRKKRAKQYNLVSFEELPEYMKDNEYILNYYRANWPLRQALFSIFRWHNETLNVWTHLLGFVLFLGLTIVNLMDVPRVADFLSIFTWSFPSSPDANISQSKNFFSGTPKLIDLKHTTPQEMELISPEMAATRWPCFVFLGGSMFCLLSSSICHLFCCHSHHINFLLLQMDYVGISVMIITSFFPPIYYIFECDTCWQFIYLGGITIMGISTIITLLSPVLSTGKFRSFRAFLFVAMGLFGLIPAIHAVIVNWSEPQRNITLAYEVVMALSYLIGTMFYVSRIPERWKPGWFDLAGHSHQIFHVFVIMGALAHYGAALIFLEFRGRKGCERVAT